MPLAPLTVYCLLLHTALTSLLLRCLQARLDHQPQPRRLQEARDYEKHHSQVGAAAAPRAAAFSPCAGPYAPWEPPRVSHAVVVVSEVSHHPPAHLRTPQTMPRCASAWYAPHTVSHQNHNFDGEDGHCRTHHITAPVPPPNMCLCLVPPGTSSIRHET